VRCLSMNALCLVDEIITIAAVRSSAFELM